MTESTRPGAGSGTRIGIDRTLCTGHGICAQILAGRFELDEWGYPIVHSELAGRAESRLAITLCPSRALYLRE